MNRYINVDNAAPPPKTAHYSHAVEAGGVLYVTGQLPVDPDNPEAPLPESIEEQTALVFVNLTRIVEGCGYKLSDAAFVRVFLTRFERDYERFNAVYRGFFEDEGSVPGRTTVGVTHLARDALIEIDMILKRGD
jgi:2-iminobutanoate/2-iminopropanoate deaminase